ncbi:MAG: amino acid ABC transporter ATP-binding protein, partial [Deltaproteobacteria bacterium]|nr:amino acid ABC transporter ATP-binding protein [Deltaproteobacteria bacterium]
MSNVNLQSGPSGRDNNSQDGAGADAGARNTWTANARTGRPLLEVRNVSKSLGGKLILDDVSLSLDKGQLKVLIGPSGSGKSTLLQCVHFLNPPDKGEVVLDGQSAREMGQKNICAFRQEIGMIFQDFNLFDHLTARENVAIALRKVKRVPGDKARARAMEELDKVGLADKADLFPAQLSGGQQQRVSIARAMAMEPKLMLLDEPTSALDPQLISEVLSVIAELAKGGMTMLMVTHQIGFARHLTSEIIFMEMGRIVEQGPPGVLLD